MYQTMVVEPGTIPAVAEEAAGTTDDDWHEDPGEVFEFVGGMVSHRTLGALAAAAEVAVVVDGVVVEVPVGVEDLLVVEEADHT